MRRLSVAFLSLAFVFLGALNADRTSVATLSPQHIVNQIEAPQEVVIAGTLANKVTALPEMSKAHIDVAFIRTEVDGTFNHAEGKILLTLKGSWPEHIIPGSSLMVRTTLQYPFVINTPGTFNYRHYLARKGIFLSGFVSSPILIRSIDTIETSFLKKSSYLIQQQRANISSLIKSNLPARIAAIYQALIIGDRSEISPADLEIFKASGIMHLLAISGMHVGLLAAMLFSLFYWLLRRSEYLLLRISARKYALLLSFPALVFYALLAGGNPPVIRSLIMISVFMISFCRDRFQSPLTTLTIAALLILLTDPGGLYTPSFQLSFVAVASILLLTPKMFSLLGTSNSSLQNKNITKRILLIFSGIGMVTIAATLGTLPLMLFHFNRISLITLPANILIQPLICFWSLPIGILASILSFISTDLSALLLKGGGIGIQAALQAGTILSESEHTQVWLPDPSITVCILYYAGLFGLTIDCPKGRPRKFIPFSSAAALSLSLLFIFLPLWKISTKTRDIDSVSILDVGHGSANVIETSSGHTILIDGGSKSAPGYDCGERIIAPFLWQRRIGRIDDIIITHDDADHYNGIPTIIKRFRPDRLIIPYVEFPKRGFQQIIATARKHGVDIVIPTHDMIINLDQANLHIFLGDVHKYSERTISHDISEDDKGLVMKFVSESDSILFPGDITVEKEKELAGRLQSIASTILLSPHHGSSSSNSYEFLKAVNPDYLIFSARDNGSDLFPSSIALKHSISLDINTFTTSEDGSVLITLIPTADYRIDVYNRSDQHFFRKS